MSSWPWLPGSAEVRTGEQAAVRPDAVVDLDAATRAGAGDFEGFARAHLPGLLGYAVALTGDRHLAADLVQDVMVRAHGRWPRIQAADRPDLYVKRMITNEHLSWRRRWHVRTVVPVDDEVLGARAPSTTDAAQRVVDRDDLWQRLAELPPRQRAVLVLRYYEGLDDAEIAQVLVTAAVTVRSNASRALAALRAGATRQEPR